MSTNKKYQIFISSTFIDLKEERDEVMKAILTHYHIPIGMEMFSAGDDEQWVTIQETIDSSDYYVLIIGHRYGSLSKEGLSYTEKEFRYALKKKIPVHVFIRDRNASTTPNQRDSDPALSKFLENFIKLASTKRMVDSWATKDDLALKVMASLNKAFSRSHRIGWVRADQVINSENVLEQMSELYKKNMELMAENEQLRLNSIKNTRMPKFDFTLNSNNELALTFDDSNYPDELFLPHDDEYNKNKILYLRANTFQPLSFQITNSGTIKATSLYIDIYFPSGINVISPTDLIDDFYYNGMDTSVSYFMNMRDDDFFSSIPQIKLENDFQSVSTQSDGNQSRLTFFLNNFPHTRTLHFCQKVVAPLMKLQDNKITVKIICEELPEPIILNFPIEVNVGTLKYN